ncbi:dUTP diphosphatase [Bacillus suaedaesalsae]|uniref:dUTP diphosphatase n=1 Tax=Bacillus suaedaesalsae TaxID=2810349 RepID=A0ABS2DGG3_9BACI|nr:dUTP diphosphatase [Bacillus suaedaesalsae]MBM6617517.1 dUTP diphosphatase [Bacillus suaedaesalsae]
MNMNMLFKMQKELDQRIIEEHSLHNEELFERKILALLVEVGELANETRCFKYWSKKGASPKEVILEEYVDGLHFILSLGIEKGFETIDMDHLDGKPLDTVTAFFNVYSFAISYKNEPSQRNYEKLLVEFLLLAKGLGYSYKEIEDAYVKKNTVNHERQNSGY